jgi:hypothetical protein
MRKSSLIAKGFDAAAYQYTLEQGLIPLIENGDIFQQDNAPIHIARTIKRWLKIIALSLSNGQQTR